MKKKKTLDSWLTKAYKDPAFLSSPEARIIRIMSEMIQPAARFSKYGVEDTVVFFGSARAVPRKMAAANLKKTERLLKKSRESAAAKRKCLENAEYAMRMSRYYEDALLLSKKLTTYFNALRKKGRNLMICSGGGPGIMEAANRGARRAKGKSIGLNISLPMEQYPNNYQTRELSMEFHYFFIRKFWFFSLAKALVVFPGGFGTLDEFFELLTLMQTGKSQKSISVVLYGKEYWKDVVDFKNMIKWGTIESIDTSLFKMCDNVDQAFRYLKKELSG